MQKLSEQVSMQMYVDFSKQ